MLQSSEGQYGERNVKKKNGSICNYGQFVAFGCTDYEDFQPVLIRSAAAASLFADVTVLQNSFLSRPRVCRTSLTPVSFLLARKVLVKQEC